MSREATHAAEALFHRYEQAPPDEKDEAGTGGSHSEDTADDEVSHHAKRHHGHRSALIQVTEDGSFTKLDVDGLTAAVHSAEDAARAAEAAAEAARKAAEKAAETSQAQEAVQPSPMMRKQTANDLKVLPAEEGVQQIGLVVMADAASQKRYAQQIQSVRCYVQQQGYDLWLLDGLQFHRCNAFHSDFFYLKHCAVAELLSQQVPGYAAAVVDADVVAAVLDRSLDSWVQSTGDLQFYERITGLEVMAGNYIAKNVPWVRHFLHRWAEYRSHKPPGFSSSDNGAIHVLLVQILELEGAQHVTELYGNLTAKVGNLEPYWEFVKSAQKVLGPPRAWLLDHTDFGQEHGCGGLQGNACVLAIFPRMSFFADDGVYLHNHASSLVGPLMHHGIKDSHDVESIYYESVWSCSINIGKILVSPGTLGQEAMTVAKGYPELYPQGTDCEGPLCAEACVSSFTCAPLQDDEEPLMREWQRIRQLTFTSTPSGMCLVIVLNGVAAGAYAYYLIMSEPYDAKETDVPDK